MNSRGRNAFLAAALLGLGAWHSASGATCPTESLLIDTTGYVRTVAAIWGEAPGETFFAEDTLIAAITVWRWAVESDDPAPMKLWITEIDSSGRPTNDQIVYDGPVLQVVNGDG